MRPDLRWSAVYAGAIGAFVTAELLAITGDRPGRTFTSQTRWVEASIPGPARWVARVTILGLTTWAGIHLAEGLQ